MGLLDDFYSETADTDLSSGESTVTDSVSTLTPSIAHQSYNSDRLTFIPCNATNKFLFSEHKSTTASEFEHGSSTASEYQHESPAASEFEYDSPTTSEISEILSKKFNDAREIIDMVVTTASDPPLAWKREAAKITTTLNGMMLKVMHVLEKHLQDQEVKMKERMKHIEAEEKLVKQMQIQNEMTKAREECAGVSGKWRHTYA